MAEAIPNLDKDKDWRIMSVYFMKDTQCIDKLFDGWQETLIWSCLQGCMGSAYADDPINPRSVQIVIADFCFFAGIPNENLVKHKPKNFRSDFIIMTAREKAWNELIEKSYGEDARRVSRYAIKKESDVFDCEKLNQIVNQLCADYSLQMIDEEIFAKIGEITWAHDLCAQFADAQEYQKNGIGVVVMKDGEILSGASSYTFYHEGIEIEIDTREDSRRKGLALACGAKLILECKNRSLYPSWDAQNMESVQLAEKLGYHLEKEYTAYEIANF